MTIDPRIRKFKRAIEFVGGLDRRTFNIDWFGDDKPKCGFVGCAVGWIAHKKLFRGLRLIKDDCEEYDLEYKSSNGVSYGRMKAVEKLFAISEDDVAYLFGVNWSNYDQNHVKPTPKRVAARMQAFMDNGFNIPRVKFS